MRLVDLGEWQFCLVLWILKLEVKLLAQVRNQYLEVAFGECFAEADTLSSMEGSPARGFSLLARGGQVKFTVRVKPLWNELHGALPFVRVVTQSLEHDK